jgi:Inclusion body protein
LPNNETAREAISRDPIGEPTNRTIYLRAIIDVESVLRDRTDPPTETERPTTVRLDSGQMFVTTTAGTADQGTGIIPFNASVGDIVRFYAKSGSNNFEHAVLIKDVRYTGDDKILEGSELVKLQRMVITPGSDAAVQTEEAIESTFWFWQGVVAGEGTQGYSLVLALYDRDANGRPRFAGLYRWGLQLTVQPSPLPPEANTQKQERTS